MGSGDERAEIPSGDPLAAGSYSPEALSDRFAERLASRYESRDKTGSGLTIALGPKGSGSGSPGVSGPVGDLRARARTVGGGAGTGPGRSGPGRTAGSGLPRRKASVFISRQTVDMGPWAESAMALILSKWALPEAHQIVHRNQVAISTVIEKNGEISRLEILSGTTSSYLDTAALEALRLSSPFHRLPEDFPGSSLEALFLFTYEY